MCSCRAQGRDNIETTIYVTRVATWNRESWSGSTARREKKVVALSWTVTGWGPVECWNDQGRWYTEYSCRHVADELPYTETGWPPTTEILTPTLWDIVETISVNIFTIISSF